MANGLSGYSGAKVFTATKARDREELGETLTRWLGAHPELEIVSTEIKQSSDNAFHCLSIVVFHRPAAVAGARAA